MNRFERRLLAIDEAIDGHRAEQAAVKKKIADENRPSADAEWLDVEAHEAAIAFLRSERDKVKANIKIRQAYDAEDDELLGAALELGIDLEGSNGPDLLAEGSVSRYEQRWRDINGTIDGHIARYKTIYKKAEDEDRDVADHERLEIEAHLDAIQALRDEKDGVVGLLVGSAVALIVRSLRH